MSIIPLNYTIWENLNIVYPQEAKKGSFSAALNVEILGFEPRQTEPKSVVLPLHHISMRPQRYAIFLNNQTVGINYPITKLRKASPYRMYKIVHTPKRSALPKKMNAIVLGKFSL